MQIIFLNIFQLSNYPMFSKRESIRLSIINGTKPKSENDDVSFEQVE